MSVSYQAVGWNAFKKRYDLWVLVGVVVFLAAFVGVSLGVNAEATLETMLIRATATAAVVLLPVILMSGPLVLLARAVSVGVAMPLTKLRCGGNFRGTLGLLTWGGLRGGISIALALSLTEAMSREVIVYLTYPVVVFSILVQGLTTGRVVKVVFGKGSR